MISLDLITALLLTTLASLILAISSHSFNYLDGSELPLTFYKVYRTVRMSFERLASSHTLYPIKIMCTILYNLLLVFLVSYINAYVTITSSHLVTMSFLLSLTHFLLEFPRVRQDERSTRRLLLHFTYNFVETFISLLILKYFFVITPKQIKHKIKKSH